MNEEYRKEVEKLLEKYRTNSLTKREMVTLVLYAKQDFGLSSAIEEHDSLVKAVKSIKPLWKRLLNLFTKVVGLSLLIWALVSVFTLNNSSSDSLSSNSQNNYVPPSVISDDGIFDKTNEYQRIAEEAERNNDLLTETQRDNALFEESLNLSEAFRYIPRESGTSVLIRGEELMRRLDSLVLNSLKRLLEITKRNNIHLDVEMLQELKEDIESSNQESIYKEKYLEIIDLLIEEEFSKVSDVIARMPKSESPETQRDIDDLKAVIQTLIE